MKWNSLREEKYFYLHKFVVLTVSKGKKIVIIKDDLKLTGEMFKDEFYLFSIQKNDLILSWDDTLQYAKDNDIKMTEVIVNTIFSLFSDLRKFLYRSDYRNIRIRPAKTYRGKKACKFKNELYDEV